MNGDWSCALCCVREGAREEPVIPIPLWVARLNRRGINHLARPLARWAPGFAVVVHTGRVSGQLHRTPVNVFPAGGDYVIALTYGPGTDWLKNVLASGRCTLEMRGRSVACTDPRVFHDESRAAVGPGTRAALRVLGVADFVALHPVRPPGA